MLRTVFTQSVTSRILWRAIVARSKTVITFSPLLLFSQDFSQTPFCFAFSPLLRHLHSLFLPTKPSLSLFLATSIDNRKASSCATNPSDSKLRAKRGTAIEPSAMAVCDAIHWVEPDKDLNRGDRFDALMGAAGSKLEKALGDQFPEGERYFGLENFGNTCYCNSVLQVFADSHLLIRFRIRLCYLEIAD